MPTAALSVSPWSRDFTEEPDALATWAPDGIARASSPRASALPSSAHERRDMIARAARIANVPADVLEAHAAHGLQPSAAAVYEASVRAAAGSPPDASTVPPSVTAALVEYARTADVIVGPDRAIARAAQAAVGFDFNPVHHLRRAAHAAERVVRHPGGAAESAAHLAEKGAHGAEHLAERGLDAGLNATFRVGRFVFGMAAHPGATWAAGMKAVDGLPAVTRTLAAQSWKTLQGLATGELAEEAVRAMIRTSLKPLLQSFLQLMKVAVRNFGPETIALGGAAVIARLAGAAVALDARKLDVARRLGDVGARRLVHQVVGHLPEPPNFGPVRARDIWRHRVRGPVETALAKALVLTIVALATGKEEDVLAAIAGVGVLSWASVSLKKVLDFVIAQAIGLAGSLVVGRAEHEITALLGKIGIDAPLAREVLAAFKTPLPA